MNLLDSDILTLVYHGRPGLTERVSAAQAAGLVALPLVVRLEALRGRIEAVLKAATAAELLAAQERLEKTESFLTQFPVVRFDDRSATEFDRLRADKKFKKLGRDDLLIASIALSTGATLVTRNTKDFAPIPGLTVENWAD